MRTIDEWLAAYGDSHQNPINETIHRIAVPIIVLDVLGFLHAVPTARLAAWLPPLSWLFALATLAFYARLSRGLAVGMAVLAIVALTLVDAVAVKLGAAFVPALVAVFVVTWVAQFIGHSIEGKKPSFFEDVQFLLIGPIWLLADVYRRAGYPVGDQPQAA
jgi:uncharacterized membrane protein YGL010W